MATAIKNDYINQIICGDCLKVLRMMPDNMIDVILCSPPYYGLRDYKVDGQIGLEEHYEIYLDKLNVVFKECQRVLKPTGSLWIVIGDTYSSNSSYSPSGRQGYNNNKIGMINNCNGISVKSLILIPQRLLLRLVDTGWIIRNDIIWHKPNRMPSSVKDRLTNSFEHIIFAVKSRKYYFNLDAIRHPYSSTTFDRINQRTIYLQKGGLKQKGYAEMYGDSGNANLATRITQCIAKYYYKGYQGKFLGFGDESEKFGSPRSRNERKILANTGANNKEPYQDYNPHRARLACFRPKSPPQGNKNKYADPQWNRQAIEKPKRKIEQTAEHFVAKGSGGNVKLPWKPKLQGVYEYEQYGDNDDSGNRRARVLAHLNEGVSKHLIGSNPGDVFVCNTHPFPEAHFATFPPKLVEFVLKAACPKDGIVLDPFMGSGTTAVVAKQMGLNYAGIELNPDYIKLAEKRLAEIDAIQINMEI